MKLIYILMPLLLASFVSKADADNLTGSGLIDDDFFPHFNRQSLGKQENSRLKAKVYSVYRQGFTPVDSVYYIYKGDRGGATKQDNPNNDDNILFDESYTYAYNLLNGQYENKLYRLQQFDGDNKVQSLVYKKWETSFLNWKDSARYLYDYANGIMVSSIFYLSLGGSWSAHVQSDLSYDANSNVTEMKSDGYLARFTYDASNNLIEMIDSARIHPAGNWVLKGKRTFVYNPTSNVIIYTLESWDDATASISKVRWEYTYTGKSITTATKFNWNGSDWINEERHTYTYDGKGNKTEDIEDIWDASANSFVKHQREEWEYNRHNQPQTITSYTWDGSTWSHSAIDWELKFYYEYSFPTDVNNVNAANQLLVYPTVANNEVNVSVNWDKYQQATVAVYDMNGRMVKALPVEKTQNLKISIPVQELGAGNYIVKVNGETEQLAARITVAH